MEARIGVAFDGFSTTSDAIALAKRAVEAGAQSLWMAEHLGYREAQLLADSVIGASGTRVRGHEFHYASLIAGGSDQPFADLRDAQGRPVAERGGRRGLVTGTFFHAIAQAPAN